MIKKKELHRQQGLQTITNKKCFIIRKKKYLWNYYLALKSKSKENKVIKEVKWS